MTAEKEIETMLGMDVADGEVKLISERLLYPCIHIIYLKLFNTFNTPFFIEDANIEDAARLWGKN